MRRPLTTRERITLAIVAAAAIAASFSGCAANRPPLGDGYCCARCDARAAAAGYAPAEIAAAHNR